MSDPLLLPVQYRSVKLVSAGADLIDSDPDTDNTGDSDTLEDKELGADREALAASVEKEHRNSDEILVNLYDNLRYLNNKHGFYKIEL